MNDQSNKPLEYDFVVVGGGSSGCIVAKRLSEHTGTTVALIEAGPIDEGVPSLMDLGLLDEQTAVTEWGFAAQTDEQESRSINYSRARMLGGCGNHNDCAFVQPTDEDLDRWVASGARGWDSSALAAAKQKVLDKVNIERPRAMHAVSQAFIDAGKAIGLDEVNFCHGIQTGVGAFPMNVTDRHRQSASVAYLHPIDELPDNLSLLTETFVEKLIFENNTVVGCETSAGQIMARKCVILTAGSIQTPQLLMVSGIGPKEVLNKAGVYCQLDLPGVGANLQDHCSSSVVLSLSDTVSNWYTTPYEATMMVSLEPDSASPDVLFHFGLRVGDMNGRNSESDSTNSKPGNGVKFEPNVMRPLSRGHLTITNHSMRTPPKISLNYLSDPDGKDMNTLIAATRYAVELAQTEPFQSLGAEVLAPTPTELSTDESLARYIEKTCETVYHACGTCRMGNSDDCVVGTDLKVRGLDGLYIADASVFPEIVSGNINMTVMMVAEKAAELLSLEL